jgi:carboxyl-terminal processing protease
LQDYARAKLVGTKTYGKGSVQTIENLSFGGAIKFTTAHYLTPKGRAINGKGLKPDVLVKMNVEKMANEKTDTQLQRALEVVRSQLK